MGRGAWQPSSRPPIDPRARCVIDRANSRHRGNPLMNMQDRSDTFDMNKYGVGQPVPRTEDPVLVQGQGRYTDDLNLPGQAYAVFVRSRNAHGDHQGDRDQRRQGNAGRARGLHRRGPCRLRHACKCVVPFKNRDGSEMKKPPRHVAATDKVRFVGDPVAVRHRRDVDCRRRMRPKPSRSTSRRCPPSPRASEAAKPGAPQLYDDVPGNVALDYHLRRSRQGRGGVRQGRARHQAQPRQQPRGRERDGAALGDRVVRQGERPLHDEHRLPGRVRHEEPARRHPRRARPTRCTS